MAQREKEETKFKHIETLNLCINNCGFSGNPSTKNMCQNCFESSSVSSSSSSSASSPSSSSINTIQTSLTTSKTRSSSIQSLKASDPTTTAEILHRDDLTHDKHKPKKSVQREVNRCSGCRKKVGLTGFRCRCGDLFCPEHRYSDRHDCSYDYKAEARETIARENPIVKPAKIIRL